jgi:NACHT domain
LATAALKIAGIIRAAFEYQDLIGIEVLIDFFRNPARYAWVELESEDREHLDDVVALRKDGKFEYTQVKFTVDPGRYQLSWDWLLESRAHGTSRLRKWANSLSTYGRSGGIGRAELRTNRKPDSEFAKGLYGNKVRPNKIPAARRAEVERELGGAAEARAFFKQFEFSHSEIPDVPGLEQRLKGTIVPTDTTTDGWMLLRQQVRRWATERKQPEPDGKIRHEHLVQIISRKRPRPIPQNFLVPEIYAVPSLTFHDRFLKRVTQGRSSIFVLWGTPGRGKSTYLSFLVNELNKKRLPCIRHHYFLSLDDTTTDRISFSDVANSLMGQISAHYPEAVKDHNSKGAPNDLRKWLSACGEYFAKNDKKFYVVIDGLDHVWRERLNIDQMNHLFNYLLPCSKHVVLIVGTQRVADLQLPSRLLTQAPDSAWIEIPSMDERALRSWVEGQDKAKRLRLPDYGRRKDQRKETLDEVSQAFFDISHGHPLHLIYSFETLVRKGTIVTADEVKILPRCPAGDIRRYYKSLWGRLKSQGKQALHLVAGADFRWPADGLRRCGGSLDEIDHLLEHRRTGVAPFHGSILAYAREQPDHESTYRALLPKVIRWLERDAPPFWRWGWLWVAKARNGKPADLLAKPTRNWVIDSLANGWPDTQIIAILRQAEIEAFSMADYCRCIELRSLKVRVQNGPEFQMYRYPEFIEAAVRSSKNEQQILNMADEIGSLSDAQLIALLRSLPDELSEEIGSECEAELRRRVNLWLVLRHRGSDHFRLLLRRAFEALSKVGSLNVKRTLSFIDGFGESDPIYHSLLTYLTRGLQLDALVELHGLLKAAKRKEWRGWTEDSLVRAFSVAGADLRTRIEMRPANASPLMACYLTFQGELCPLLNFKIDPALLQRERYEYGPNAALEEFFHAIFFAALATSKASTGEFSFVLPGMDQAQIGWTKYAVDSLRNLARDIAEGTVGANFASVFQRANDVAPVAGRRTTEADSAQYWSFKSALQNIAVDLQLLASPGEHVSSAHFAAARNTRHWQDEGWLSDNLGNRFVLLEKEGAQTLVDSLRDKANRSITVFNERAERWVELALFSLLYGLPEAPGFVRRSADCLVGYGCHKDVYIYEVLGSIDLVRTAGSQKVSRFVKQIAPIVDNTMDMTDGDEVGGSRLRLIKLIAEISPHKLPDCYEHHIRADEFSLAEDALAAHCKKLTFDNEAEKALARTFLERRDILLLSEQNTAGVSGAGEAVVEQQRFIGGTPASREFDRHNNSDGPSSKGKPPDIRKFKPSQFAKLVGRADKLDLAVCDDVLRRWLEYWTKQRKGREALKAIESFFNGTEKTYPAERILDDAFLASLAIQGKKEAYKWLVRAHVVRHGWGSYWTSEEEVVKRLEWAAKHYRSRWREFIRDTSKPDF